MRGEEKTVGDHALVVIFLVLLAVIAWAYWRRSRALGQSSRNEVDIEREGDQKTRIRHERGI